MNIISDGTGKGHKLKIDEDNRAVCAVITETEESYISGKYGLSFAINCGLLTTNSLNEHKLLYLRNNNSNKDMRIWGIRVGWNGGSTNFNKPVIFNYYGLPKTTLPTNNYQATTPVNINYGSNNQAETTAYIWDGVGDGMTIDTTGINKVSQILSIGHNNIETNGVPILKLNNNLLLSIQCYEIGDFTLSIRYIFK